MIYMYTIYDLSTGRFCQKFSSKNKDAILNNVDDGFGYVEGDYDIARKMVVDGEIVDVPEDDVIASRNAYAWQMLRNMRNEALQACDWTQMPDAPVDQAAWAAYRQQLRDLPANTVDPASPVWPTPPA